MERRWDIQTLLTSVCYWLRSPALLTGLWLSSSTVEGLGGICRRRSHADSFLRSNVRSFPISSVWLFVYSLVQQVFIMLLIRTHSKRPWCRERLKAGGEWDDRRWDGWMASPIRWTWVWINSGSRWWTGRPGVLQSMGSQRVGHDRETGLNWTEHLEM